MKYLPVFRRSTAVVPNPNNMQTKALLNEIPIMNATNNSSYINSPPWTVSYFAVFVVAVVAAVAAVTMVDPVLQMDRILAVVVAQVL
jgi:hypothetical protein